MTANQIGELMVEEQPGAIAAWANSFPIGVGTDKFGLGFQITGKQITGFRAKGSCSWAGIWNTHFWFDPENEIAGVVLMQVQPFYDKDCIKVLRGFESLVYQSQDRIEFTSHSFVSNGTKIAYEIGGKGSPVVLIHGLTGSRKQYAPLAKDLVKAGFRTIAVDLRGHGESGKPHDPSAYGELMLLDIGNLLNHLSIDSAHIVGYSMGGDIVNKFREKFPAKTRSCIIGGAGLGVAEGWADEAHSFIELAR